MTTLIHDIHIAQSEPLPEPRLLREELPAGETEAAFITAARRATRAILRGVFEQFDSPELEVVRG